MGLIVGLFIGLAFLLLGGTSVACPEKVRDYVLKSNQKSVQYWGWSERNAESWVKRNVVSSKTSYFILGFVEIGLALIVLYTIVRTWLTGIQ